MAGKRGQSPDRVDETKMQKIMKGFDAGNELSVKIGFGRYLRIGVMVQRRLQGNRPGVPQGVCYFVRHRKEK
jgi:hypothetical protein